MAEGAAQAVAATLSAGLGQVLVLNASYEPLNVCSVRRAHVLVFKGKAEVLEEHETASSLGDGHVCHGRT